MQCSLRSETRHDLKMTMPHCPLATFMMQWQMQWLRPQAENQKPKHPCKDCPPFETSSSSEHPDRRSWAAGARSYPHPRQVGAREDCTGPHKCAAPTRCGQHGNRDNIDGSRSDLQMLRFALRAGRRRRTLRALTTSNRWSQAWKRSSRSHLVATTASKRGAWRAGATAASTVMTRNRNRNRNRNSSHRAKEITSVSGDRFTAPRVSGFRLRRSGHRRTQLLQRCRNGEVLRM